MVALRLALPLLLLALAAAPPARAEPAAAAAAIEARIPPPPGFQRVPAPGGSFAAFLRRLPLLPGRPPVLLYDGRRKSNQDAHFAVVDLDVGSRDLQQCADAAIRLRAEYQRASGRDEAICFRFTSGDPAPWSRWRDGERPRISGSRVTWAAAAPPDGGPASFRRYLDAVFTYAGSASLARDLVPVPASAPVEAGDVFVQGGFPGHAVLVADVAEDGRGRRAFLLVQSYMPAQQVHVLRAPGSSLDPWYPAEGPGPLVTPEWTFPSRARGRFPESGCGP
ncbi:DUF4846 domain-containing protein [Myxococcota bacterium]|nr:DUF4846 domain-containing protein [Myxococcota bacterium]